MVEQSSPLEVFCSYSHQDEGWLRKLITHLRLLEHEGLVLIWHDRLLTGGANWAQEIDDHFNRARLILLLISPDFVASDYCYGIEMQRALERHKANEARVIPLLVRPVGNWQIAPFARLQALPPGKFLTEWSEREEDIPLAQIAIGIRTALKDLLTPAASMLHANQSTIWTVPYPRNPFFTGREAELNAIKTALSTGQHAAIGQAISGLGGIGKTQLALEYAYRSRAEYRSVFWVLADTRDTLSAAYSAIADLLNLPERHQREQHIVVEAVKEWLARHQGWLLILDNADDLSVARDFLPTGVPGHILLTTRAHAMGRLAERIEIKKLEEEEGISFLLRRSSLLRKDAPLQTLGAATREAAREIVREVDGLPLALDQAGAYLEETNCSLHDYLVLYRTQRAELLRLRGGHVDDHPAPIATTWQLAFARIEESDAAAADLLRLCAFLAPDGIPETIIGQGETELTAPLRRLAERPLQLNAALATLQAYSLVARHPDTHTLDVHRLVQAVLRDAMTKEEERVWAERAVKAVAQIFPWPEVANWEVCRQLLPHAQVCATLIEGLQMELREGAGLLACVGSYFDDRAEYHEAQGYGEQALALYRAVFGEQHPFTANSLNNLGEVYRAQGKNAEAEAAFLQVLAITRVVLGEQHPSTANSLSNLGLVYYQQGKYAEAEAVFLQVLATRRVVLGEQHPSTAGSLSNLGLIYYQQRKYAEAEAAFLQALATRRVVLGEQHPDTAAILNNLGEVHRVQRKYAEAEAAFLQVLTTRRAVFGEQHPFTADSLNNLGLVYYQQGKHAEAEAVFLQALTIQRMVLGEQHPSTASSLNSLGLVYQSQGKGIEAEAAHLQALTIQRMVLGEQHPDTAASLNSLANLYRAQEKYKEALPLFERALTSYQEKLGPEHPYTKNAQKNYEQTVQAMKRQVGEQGTDVEQA